MPAKFKAEATFAVAGRGLVLSGEILQGTLKVGMKVQIPSWPSELTIRGVEFISHIDRQPRLGLLFSSHEESEFARWRALDLKDQVLEIHDETPAISNGSATCQPRTSV